MRLQFRIFDPAKHNSGVFVRFPRPTLDLDTPALKLRAMNEPAFDANNPAWRPTVAGFEVQVDDTAAGDPNKKWGPDNPHPLSSRKTELIWEV